MKSFNIFKRYFPLILFFAVVIISCTSIINPPEGIYTAYAPQKKINLNVGLNITDELRRAKWEKDTWLLPIGEWLAPNSVSFANHVFASVVDVTGGSHNPDLVVDAVLTPKVAFINRTVGATSFGESIITVKVEWDLRTPAGKPIWVETVSGEASGSSGWTNPDNILEEALDKLMKNSQKALISSQAISHFVANR